MRNNNEKFDKAASPHASNPITQRLAIALLLAIAAMIFAYAGNVYASEPHNNGVASPNPQNTVSPLTTYSGSLELPVRGATGWAGHYITMQIEVQDPPPVDPPDGGGTTPPINPPGGGGTTPPTNPPSGGGGSGGGGSNCAAVTAAAARFRDEGVPMLDFFIARQNGMLEFEGFAPLATLSLNPGQVFTILEATSTTHWRIELPDGTIGTIPHALAFINLPDVIPSISYMAANVTGNVFRSLGQNWPGFTGTALTPEMRDFNDRLGRVAYIVPILYSAARVLNTAQQAALANNESLVVWEAYRPFEVQVQVREAFAAYLSRDDVNTNAVLASPSPGGNAWTQGWFIGQGVSNHQRGDAVDVSLATVVGLEARQFGAYTVMMPNGLIHPQMPSGMHDLSGWAEVRPGSSNAWAAQPLQPPGGFGSRMNENPAGIRMHNYMVNAGFTALPSEWWHFDLRPSGGSGGPNPSGAGGFRTPETHSRLP